MKPITVSLRDFAIPVPRCGSIDTHSGYGLAETLGQEIHRRVQKGRAVADPFYRAEVSVSGFFERGGYRFRVDGRIDGLFRHDPPKIEEIKTGFNIRDLAQRLAGNLHEHPYSLQLLTYGYLYHREHIVIPRLFFHLVSSRSGESLDLEIPLEIPSYEEWLDRRLDRLVTEAEAAGKRASRRRKMAGGFPFPFSEPRRGQVELMETVRKGLAGERPMLIQAPTGMGKTVGVLHPVLTEALGSGERVVYVTPKNSQHLMVEEAVERFRKAGARLKSLTITAKGKVCFKGEPLCTPEYCEYAEDYYSKVDDHGLRDILAGKRRLTPRVFRELGERYRVCPFELQFEAAEMSDIVICDYNYVFAPRTAGSRLTAAGIGQTGRPSLIIDEAHNLPARAMEHYSPSLSSDVLERMRDDISMMPPGFRRDGEAVLDGCIRVVASCKSGESERPARIDPPVEVFLEQDARLRAFLTRYLASGTEVERNDPVLRLFLYWSEFTAALGCAADQERGEFFTTYSPDPSGGTVRITCCDASEMIKERYGEFCRVVVFSATLRPFEYYARLSGLDPERVITAEFPSPFPREHRKLLIIPQISTRYSRRERNYLKIAEAVRRIAALKRGNYFLFLPSFEFLERVAERFIPPDGFVVLKQERGMQAAGVEALLGHLREGSLPTLLLAVQGGSFSEGLDYAGDMAIGAFVAGPPLPVFDLEREEMRRYYQKKYGAGFEYAYIFPAMARAVQSAGRVIRSENDRGLIVLLDDRFLEEGYSRAMPSDWFDSDAKELVSASILKDVAEFWAR